MLIRNSLILKKYIVGKEIESSSNYHLGELCRYKSSNSTHVKYNPWKTTYALIVSFPSFPDAARLPKHPV